MRPFPSLSCSVVCGTGLKLRLFECRYFLQRTGAAGDGGVMVGSVLHSSNRQQANCGHFFGNCSNVFLLLFLLLVLAGGLWLVRSVMRKRYAQVNRGLEYDDGEPDEIEA